jgi:hypothetical protein
MISSPCKTCHRSGQPKEDCYKNCELLQGIQDIQLSFKEGALASEIEYSGENRFALNLSIEKYLPPFT